MVRRQQRLSAVRPAANAAIGRTGEPPADEPHESRGRGSTPPSSTAPERSSFHSALVSKPGRAFTLADVLGVAHQSPGLARIPRAAPVSSPRRVRRASCEPAGPRLQDVLCQAPKQQPRFWRSRCQNRTQAATQIRAGVLAAPGVTQPWDCGNVPRPRLGIPSEMNPEAGGLLPVSPSEHPTIEAAGLSSVATGEAVARPRRQSTPSVDSDRPSCRRDGRFRATGSSPLRWRGIRSRINESDRRLSVDAPLQPVPPWMDSGSVQPLQACDRVAVTRPPVPVPVG
jgi:hypothetical protein